MPEFQPQSRLPYPYPRHLTVPQFLLDELVHPLRPRRDPDSPWLIDGVTGRSYRLQEIKERVEQVARAAKARWDLKPGDVVCMYSPNDIDYPIVIWAMHRLGCIVTGANPLYTVGELEYQLKETSSKLLFTVPMCLPKALEAASRSKLFDTANVVILSPRSQTHSAGDKSASANLVTVDRLAAEGAKLDKNYTEPRGPLVGETVAYLGFSSGTTGLPKAVAVPHRGAMATVLQMCWLYGVNDSTLPPGDSWINRGDLGLGVLPFYHIYGLVGVLHSLLFCGAGVVVIPGFQLEHFLGIIVKYRIAHIPVVPPILMHMLNSPITRKYDLSCVRWLLSAGAPLSAEVMQDLRKLVPRARAGMAYGLTETSSLVSMFPWFTPPVDGSCGILVPDTCARIVKPDGSLAHYDESGEIWVKGPQTAIGYLNNPKATEETFLPGGWLRTGDLGYIARDGSLFIVDRLKELIKVSGFQVAPAELEGHLMTHPHVQDVGVIGIPHQTKGEVPLAFVVLTPAVAKSVSSSPEDANRIKEELKTWVSQQKVRYKWLDGGVEFVQAIPKVPSGKILRRVLKEQWKEQVKANPQAKL